MAYNTPVYSYAGVPVAPAGFYNNDPYALQPPGYGRVLPPSLGAAPTRTWDSLMGPPRATNPGYGSTPMPNYNLPQYSPGQAAYGTYGNYGYPNTPNLNAAAGVPNPGALGTPSTLMSGPNTAGTDWMSLLDKPKDLMLQAMLAAGYNPFSGGGMSGALLSQAGQLGGQIPLMLATMGGGASTQITPDLVKTMATQLVQRAMSGQSAYFGGGQAQNILGSLDQMQRGIGPEAAGTIGALARSLVNSPGDFTNTLQRLTLGGLGSRVAGALGSDLYDWLPQLLSLAMQQAGGADPSMLGIVRSGILRNPLALYGGAQQTAQAGR